MKIKKGQELAYSEAVVNNEGLLGQAMMDYAIRWAELMEKEIEASDAEPVDVIAECAERLSEEADPSQLDIVMRHVSAVIVAGYWAYGDEFDQWYDCVRIF